MPLIIWMHPIDLDPPHGLDMSSRHDADKVEHLERQFKERGFDKKYPAMLGYPLNGRVQLLSGTHRHAAAIRANVKLPIVLWLRTDIEESWGELKKWKKVLEDIPVNVLECWTREDIEKNRLE